MTDRLSGRVRVRACGLLSEEGSLLMVRIAAPTRPEPFWTVPGGGVEFGETLRQTVEREFLEETGLVVKAQELVKIQEFIQLPFHAVECYFRVKCLGGTLRLGIDPEVEPARQMLLDVAWLSADERRERDVSPDFLRGMQATG